MSLQMRDCELKRLENLLQTSKKAIKYVGLKEAPFRLEVVLEIVFEG